MRRVGLASCGPLPVEHSTVNDFHPPHGSLLQRMHFAARVKRGRRVSKSEPAPPPTPEPGCRPHRLSTDAVTLALAWDLVLVLLGVEAAARLDRG